jgi:predicted small integral membrane protein
MYTARIAKIIMVACLAAFCLLVVFGNLTDYQSNFLFVQHVMSMDTTYPGNKLMYRAVTEPAYWQAAYTLIIFGEATAGLLFLAGAIRLLQVRRQPGAVFDRAKALTVMGALAAFVLWFFGFMVVAGEWFAMWQSATWNGQEAAFRFYMTALAVLIFVMLPDRDLKAETPANEPVELTGASVEASPSKKKTAPARKKPPAKKRAPAKKRTEAKSSRAKSSTAKSRTAKSSTAETSAAKRRLAAAKSKVQEEN